MSRFRRQATHDAWPSHFACTVKQYYSQSPKGGSEKGYPEEMQRLSDLKVVYRWLASVCVVGSPFGDCEIYLEYSNLVENVPPYRLMDDIFSWVCSRPIKPCYMFDLPRGMKNNKLWSTPLDLFASLKPALGGSTEGDSGKARFRRKTLQPDPKPSFRGWQ